MTADEMKEKLRAHLHQVALDKGATEEDAARTAAALVRGADAPTRWPRAIRKRLKAARAHAYDKARAQGLCESDARRAADILVNAAMMQLMRPEA